MGQRERNRGIRTIRNKLRERETKKKEGGKGKKSMKQDLTDAV